MVGISDSPPHPTPRLQEVSVLSASRQQDTEIEFGYLSQIAASGLLY